MRPTPKQKAKIFMDRYNNDKMNCLDVISDILKRCLHSSDISFYLEVKREIEKL
jgi:hypothetical protein